MPFDGSNFKRLVKQISTGDYYEPKKPSAASPLIREMLTICPKQRATIEQICNHWWVNEGMHESCLDLAEELANQTPVRLDVLLSLAPSAVTSDQLVVPGPNDDGRQTVPRSHSVGSICDIASTEAEQRIIDMVAAGGEGMESIRFLIENYTSCCLHSRHTLSHTFVNKQNTIFYFIFSCIGSVSHTKHRTNG